MWYIFAETSCLTAFQQLDGIACYVRFAPILLIIQTCLLIYLLLQGYDSFDKSKLEGISEEDVQTKVRLTALMTLGSKSTHELQFAEVQKALGLASDSEVEAWVVRAIGKVGLPALPSSASFDLSNES